MFVLNPRWPMFALNPRRPTFVLIQDGRCLYKLSYFTYRLFVEFEIPSGIRVKFLLELNLMPYLTYRLSVEFEIPSGIPVKFLLEQLVFSSLL